MKLGIMQPYIFPYIGYFQLINVVEKFIVYDDVSYIKQGWINRNNILCNSQKTLFSVPLDNSSSFRAINEISLHPKLYPAWKKKILKNIEQNYKRAPFFEEVFPLLCFTFNSNSITISDLAYTSLLGVLTYLDIKTQVVRSSSCYENNHLKGQARVIDICKQETALQYVNSIGGKELYSKSDFLNAGIELCFIYPKADIVYDQFPSTQFIPWLSIIDVLMFNAPSKVNAYLQQYEIE